MLIAAATLAMGLLLAWPASAVGSVITDGDSRALDEFRSLVETVTVEQAGH